MDSDVLAAIFTKAAAHGIRQGLLQADVQLESSGDPFSIGDGGLAMGLMQVHKFAAAEVGVDWNKLAAAIAAKDRATAIELGLEAGALYLAKMLRLFNGNEHLALMAFNRGETVIHLGDEYATAVLALG